MSNEWAWVAQADDDFSPACADRRHDSCHEEDCVCACHIDADDLREQRSLEDYVDVATRIADFREKYPEGSLQPLRYEEPYKLVQAEGFEKDGSVTQQTFVVVVAAAYRTPDDHTPGVGMAWEIFPGRTPYTRGSELQNAETSAWGRAIIAVGASDSKRGIASREEVRNRQAERDDGLPTNADGSLSRSRTTDEQKTAAGVMTDAEQRAHNQLAKPPPNSGKTQRLIAPVEDLWATGPSGIAPETDPEDLHGTCTADQIRSLQAAFAVKGIGKDAVGAPAIRAAKIAWLVDKFGPDIHSSKDLSYTQAAQALQELNR